MSVKIENWKRAITYHANSVEVVTSAEQIAAIVKDSDRYPTPVRAKGSHHSTTKCIVAEGGTVLDMTQMNRILHIDTLACTIHMEAGVKHIDAAKVLEKLGFQFYVNVEIGNLTVGSGACGGTKDASYVSDGTMEFGQVAAYCIAVKTVQADGSLLEVSEDDGPLMEMMRSSYGMLGIIYEVTFRIKPIKPMVVEHKSYHVQDFVAQLDSLIAQQRSMMLYLFPFLDKVVVEYRYDGEGPIKSNSWQWRLRNWVWKTGSPGFGRIVTLLVPWKNVRSWILDCYNQISVWVITRVVRGGNTSPADQIILYPETAGFASYTFSIWGFPRASYGQTLLAYYQFCRDYFAEHDFRCDMLNVGYSIAEDRQSTFSYSRRGPVLTLDPVASGSPGWEEFLTAYNEFCSQHNGTPLFNQTRGITPQQAQAAFAEEIMVFQTQRHLSDPQNRFYTPYFSELFD